MKLRYLETFVVVADELHFGRAAEQLNVAQPAVSQTIAALEEELGAELFDRSRRQVSLTAAGEVFLEEARETLDQLDRASTLARRAAQGTHGRLVIGFTAACALSEMPAHITRFMRAHPGVDVRLRQMGTRDQLQHVRQGSMDVGFSVLPDADTELASRLVTADSLRAFFQDDHRFAHLDEVPVEQALAEPFLLMSREREPTMDRAFKRLCNEHEIDPNVVLEVDHLEAMMAFVAAGLGVSFAPSSAAELQLGGVASRPVTPPIDAGVSAIWSQEDLTPTAERFLERLWGESDL